MDTYTPEPTVRAPRRLFRARDDRVVAGVCGGLGRYLGIDPILLRLALVVLILLGGTGILAYIIAWIVIPEEPAAVRPRQEAGVDTPEAPIGGPPIEASSPPTFGVGSSTTVFGILLIVAGALLLADRLIPGLSWRFTGPILLVAIGVLVLTKGGSR
jgi:phage shock protein C